LSGYTSFSKIYRDKVSGASQDQGNLGAGCRISDLNRAARSTPEIAMIDRRTLLASAAGLAALFGFRWLRGEPVRAAETKVAERFEIEKTDAEWRAQLTPQQYRILRQQGTEPPFTSPLLKEHRKGIFACAGCDLPLYSSETKFESGTGWPSFWKPLDNAVGETRDTTFGMARTEIHCRRCGGLLGHVFDDGPKPTGLRYCMDGLALVFHPAAPSAT
jgi:peptide-methionine (R)-S-oxide reductase